MESSTTSLWTGQVLLCFVEFHVIFANSVDPDQRLHSVALDLGLHCLPVILLRASRLKLVKSSPYFWTYYDTRELISAKVVLL